MNEQDMLSLVIHRVRSLDFGLETEDIHGGSMLSPLGLDSIGKAELIEILLEDLQLNAHRSEFNSVNNIGELACKLTERLNNKKV